MVAANIPWLVRQVKAALSRDVVSKAEILAAVKPLNQSGWEYSFRIEADLEELVSTIHALGIQRPQPDRERLARALLIVETGGLMELPNPLPKWALDKADAILGADNA